MSFHEMSDGAKHFWDVASIGAVIGWLFSVLPSVATLLTVVWMMIRIYETRTVQGWFGRKVNDGD